MCRPPDRYPRGGLRSPRGGPHRARRGSTGRTGTDSSCRVLERAGWRPPPRTSLPTGRDRRNPNDFALADADRSCGGARRSSLGAGAGIGAAEATRCHRRSRTDTPGARAPAHPGHQSDPPGLGATTGRCCADGQLARDLVRPAAASGSWTSELVAVAVLELLAALAPAGIVAADALVFGFYDRSLGDLGGIGGHGALAAAESAIFLGHRGKG